MEGPLNLDRRAVALELALAEGAAHEYPPKAALPVEFEAEHGLAQLHANKLDGEVRWDVVGWVAWVE